MFGFCSFFLCLGQEVKEMLCAHLRMAQVNERLEFALVSRVKAHCLFRPCTHARSRLVFVHSLVGAF